MDNLAIWYILNINKRLANTIILAAPRLHTVAHMMIEVNHYDF